MSNLLFLLIIFIIKMENSSGKQGLAVSQTWMGLEVDEGDGARVRRVIGLNKMSDIDPFLMLDYFENSLLPGGFPDHPHRGFETVTYLTQGKIYHEDFKGHKGEIEEGDIQWMTAGKGIVHAEMPYSFTQPTLGIQLWINLRKEDKLIEPHYQEIKKNKIPVYEDPDGKIYVKIIAGKIDNLEGPCKSTTPTSFFDIKMKSNSECFIPISGSERSVSGLVFLFEGDSLKVADSITLQKFYAVRVDSNSESEIKFQTGNSDCRFLLIFATPLNEPIAKYGPFVMNTQKELMQAFEDYQGAKNGFEYRLTWKSEIQNMAIKNKKVDL